MSAIESLIFLLGAAAVLAQLARSVNVPYPIFLVLGGLAIAGSTTEEYAESSAAWHDWRRELLAAEREAVLSSRDEGRISPEVMRRIERDLEESRIGG